MHDDPSIARDHADGLHRLRAAFLVQELQVISPPEQTWIHWFFLSTRKEVSSTCRAGSVSSRSIATFSQFSSARCSART